MPQYHEDGWVAEVEVLKDTSDKEWLRYELKVMHTLAESSIMKTPPDGDVFDVCHKKGYAFSGMWHLTDYEKIDRNAESESSTNSALGSGDGDRGNE